MNSVPEVVVGGGIAALLYAHYHRVPVVMSAVSPPPLCAFLHDSEPARRFLDSIGIDPERRQVSHGVYWKGKLSGWPGDEESHAAYFKKSRLRDVEIDQFHRAKGASSQHSIAPMSRVYIELYQRLKLEGLVWEFHSIVMSKSFDGKKFMVRDGLSGHTLLVDRVKLAGPPEMVGIQEKPGAVKATRNVFDVFRVVQNAWSPEVLYVSDPELRIYRVSMLTNDMVMVEHAVSLVHATGEDDMAVSQLRVAAELSVVSGLGESTHLKRHSSFGFYEREYDLPEGLELVGRAATGVTKLTHHLIEDFEREAARV